MNSLYIFELENVLTDGLTPAPANHRTLIKQLTQTNPFVFINTDYDYRTLVELFGQDVCRSIGAFCNSGKSVYVNGTSTVRSKWEISDIASCYLHGQLSIVATQYSLRHGHHIQKREGCAAFSVPGFEATHAEKARFLDIDRRLKIRGKLCDTFNTRFKNMVMRLTDDGNLLITPTETGYEPVAKTLKAINLPIHYYARPRSSIRKQFSDAYVLSAGDLQNVSFHEAVDVNTMYRRIKSYQQAEKVF